MSQRFDAIIVGAGQAGPSLAGRLTAAGQRVALVERQLFGGTCVNTGCMPTKTLIASARAAHVVRRAAEFGVQIAGSLAMDMQMVKARKDKVTLNARQGVESWLKGMAGCTVFEGHARFESARSLRVGDALLSAERIFLNVGGRASIPDLPGIDDVPYLTNTSMMALAELPRHLVIVGGSYIGLEFAQMYRRFGSEVTVVERGPRLISREDTEVSSAVQAILEREGIAVHLNADSIRFARRGADIAVGTTADAEVVGSHVLVAVGRRPNTDDLALDQAGVALDARGYIVVNQQLQTNVPGIYALGDCNGRGAFTHTAYNDFEIVAANLLDGASRKLSDRIDTYALYIDPPLGRVGLSPAQARKTGHDVRVGMRPMARVGRAVEKAETDGFMQIVVDAQTQAILGATILGVGGDEAIHSILDMMAAKAPYPVLQQAMHIHPTVAELIPTLLGELKP
ncbi:Pyruvate/2-oxoglutarate dehydrogenase complex, dihydrolipoamide dehydrogenase (E3) component [Rhodoferax sp. OV413]|uniref:FAD-containing oxidoreductase n=1 Tax=Rhodoferax sp. OV413 TaxID=1855285 RepID=UPI00088E8FB3|nr:FAD-containing oxidoreductase [Rhodoferax sp. OV413]SDP72823.1 Pyruvate/2-oxoglutarate dehydrogenase complex, dihydrolipoamide dehydrogenase (E3) component [Rhodoferax sp. OV413]